WIKCFIAGSTSHTSTLPTLVRTSTLMMQSSLDIKPFVTFPVDTTSTVGLFPNFNTMDPVQKAVINHTFGVSIPPKKKQVISCSACQLRFNSESQAEAHYKGSKHARKLKSMETSKTKQKAASTKDSTKAITNSPTITPVIANSSDKPEDGGRLGTNDTSCSQLQSTVGKSPVAQPGSALITKVSTIATNSTNGSIIPSAESEEEKAKKLLYCSLCKVAVNSLSQLEAHNTGSKHKTMVEARNGAGPIKSYPRPGSKIKLQNGSKGSGLQNKTFHCEICNVHVNSEVQLKQHISSRRHKDRIAGKPIKPKYSPYNKLQRSTSVLTAKLALQKGMIKPLAPPFLSSPFTATAMTSLSIHSRPPTSLLQTPLPTTLIRPAPGPIRTSPGSILFAPY
uniref:Zinc finger protein 385B n=1 Tax=Latimeria chalumnae TaxID=7897 RepID=H3AQP4_LATCH